MSINHEMNTNYLDISIRCFFCNGLTPIIDRNNHNWFYDCPLCKEKKKINIRVEKENEYRKVF